MDEIAKSFRLNVTAVSESCNREILQHSSDDAGKDNGRTVVIWNRKDDLTKDVYLEKSQSGQLRVVKQVTTTDKSINYRSEIDLMGRISRATDKPLFVQFIGWFPYKNHVCLAMEYCPYGDLKSYYTRPIPEAEARNICTQLLDGLEVLHSLGIVHRDIKPENVLVFQKTPMKVKITDFGVSKRALEGQTEHRTACGTMGFMAPEVLHLVDDTKEDSTFTSAVDIWSLGCLLYYILTKQTPFSKYELLRDYAKGRTAFPDGHLKEYHVSRQGRKFIERLLDPLPEARPSASADLTSYWTIPDTGEESIYPEPPSPGDADPSGFSRAFGDSTQPPINDAQWIGFPDVPFELGPLSDNDMDYFSTELWNFVKSARTFDRASTVKLQALLTTHASPSRLHNGYTALHIASESAPAEWVKLLLEYGADAHIRTEPGRETSLHLSTSKGDLEDFTKKSELLLAIRAVREGINAQNSNGDTVLHLAIARFGTVSAIQPLLDAEASTNIKGRQGRTPLLYALYLEQEAVATELLDRDSDPHALDNGGFSALHYAIASRTISIQFIKRLLDAGVDVNWKNEDDRTPLYLAAQKSKQEVMRLLLDHGAIPELGNPRLDIRVNQVQFATKIGLKSLWPFS
ncbi:uncharacterized protein AKAW2_21213S [Aspergillus luchuensis]|uniref:Protein kinase domain-containing protein n=1 Tax=Aspergillus kawachii TaxID=1069201 RepID=A0A146FN62_ASPKA|nr:uncharacterized protein AKAW2_21213S [Aspergillus luchuensis]BCR96273.1 hypothetical protein AKAW2_21213S [Aspergillus luchuensis]BCS08791.1 hypothetical protein ALUC_21161S [Aspergillus luchuensis]GAT26662.1 hypothetical protein RIB2604_02103440 [Aspergillus luchuensis]